MKKKHARTIKETNYMAACGVQHEIINKTC